VCPARVLASTGQTGVCTSTVACALSWLPVGDLAVAAGRSACRSLARPAQYLCARDPPTTGAACVPDMCAATACCAVRRDRGMADGLWHWREWCVASQWACMRANPTPIITTHTSTMPPTAHACQHNRQHAHSASVAPITHTRTASLAAAAWPAPCAATQTSPMPSPPAWARAH
jgi:hypothetical protein